MADSILWEYLEDLPTQEAAWNNWSGRLSGWRLFNTFYNHYLMVKNVRVKYLKCTIECEHRCSHQVVEDSLSNIEAVCPQKKVSIRLFH